MSERRDTTVIAVALLAAYLGQAAVQLQIPWLAELQAQDWYKLVTGGVLVGYLALQWSAAPQRRELHKLLGAFAPLVLYAHTTRFAYGYLAWLVAVYLGVVAIGLLHAPIVGRRAKRLFTGWFIAHLALAVLLVILVAYHVVIAVGYE
jgi:hypothetical protein